jgi:hypothetical protein
MRSLRFSDRDFFLNERKGSAARSMRDRIAETGGKYSPIQRSLSISATARSVALWLIPRFGVRTRDPPRTAQVR